MKITIEEGGRTAEVLDVSTDIEEIYRVALQENDSEFLYITSLAAEVESLVNRWLVFPDFSFGPLHLRATTNGTPSVN